MTTNLTITGGIPFGCDGQELVQDLQYHHQVHYTREYVTTSARGVAARLLLAFFRCLQTS